MTSRSRTRIVSDSLLDSDPPYECMGQLLTRTAAEHGASEFLRFDGRSVSFHEAEEFTARLANVLASKGVTKGDRVAIMLPNCAEWPLAWLALLRIGAVTVPVNWSYRERDLQHVLTDSGAVIVITQAERTQLVESVRTECPDLRLVTTLDDLEPEIMTASAQAPSVEVESGDLANLQYTSGTTGFPKACMLTHDYWIRIGWLAAGGAQLVDDDVVLTSQPFSYIDPQWNTAMCLIGAVPLVVLERFSASGFWADVRRNGVSLFYVLGTMPVLLLKQPPIDVDRDNRVRLVMCSGIHPELHTQLEERWGAPWREAYGMTESGVDLLVSLDDYQMVGSGSIGRPVPTKDVRIFDPDGNEVPDGEHGEIVVKGRPMMLGYWNQPEATAQTLRDGWLRTGDVGYRDSDGWFYIVGRLKDMVRRGGENIACAEVERVLAQHPKVMSSAVVPIPDELFGEEVKAYVQLREPTDDPTATAEELLTFADEQLARFKVPRFIEFIDEFPLTPSERVAKPKLLEARSDQRAGAYDRRHRKWG